MKLEPGVERVLDPICWRGIIILTTGESPGLSAAQEIVWRGQPISARTFEEAEAAPFMAIVDAHRALIEGIRQLFSEVT